MSYKIVAALIACAINFIAFGQSVPGDSQAYKLHATIGNTQDGKLSIEASSPRPLEQAITALRRQFGWTVDYEDPIYEYSQIKLGYQLKPRLLGGQFKANISMPVNNSPDVKSSTLSELIQQFNQQSETKFHLLQESATRFDIVPDIAGQKPILDTTIKIDDSARTIGDTVNIILSEISKQKGIPIIRGGLIDNDLENTRISLKHTAAVPARQLLNEALNKARTQKVWVLAFEPADNCFYLGIETSVKAEKLPSGQMIVHPILNRPD